MKMKEKVKKFYTEHKEACIAVGVGGVVLVGEIIGWKLCVSYNGLKPGRHVITDNDFNRVLADSLKRYKGSACSKLWFISDMGESIKLEDLGKLGDVAKEAGYLHMDQELTHIIALGKPILEKND